MKFAMGNCKRKIVKKKCLLIFCIWNRLLFVYLSLLLLLLFLCHNGSVISAHYIQIDHNYHPRPALPPPPPLPPIEQLPPQHLPAKELTPAEFMVDLTNDLTYRILHYHSILNRNNFAFSPTALMSVLVALYEGSAGRSALELRNVLQLPNNKDVIRVGYRDIHRRLRTYFFGSDNPLKGLSLNKDNVTILRDYETVLMFYGYDLGMDMVSSVATTTTTTTAKETTTTELSTILPATATTTAEKEISKENVATTTMETVLTETTTTTTGTTTITITEKPTILTTQETTTATPAAIATEEVTTNAATETDTNAETTAATVAESETETVAPNTAAETETETEKAENEEAAELVSTFVAEAASNEPFLRIEKARVTMLPSGRLQAPPKSQQKQKSAAMKPKPTRLTATSASPIAPSSNIASRNINARTVNTQKAARLSNIPAVTATRAQNLQKLSHLYNNDAAFSSSVSNNYLPAASRTFQSERLSSSSTSSSPSSSSSSTRQTTRQRRHLLGSFKDADANLFVTLFHPQPQPPPHHNLYTISGPSSASSATLAHVANEFDVEVEPHFITSNSGFSSATETKQNYNTDIVSHIFYLGNQDVIYTTYKVYNAVLYYKYFEHLKMNILELELDTPEYNLMILLPDYHTDLVTAAASLRLGPTLRLLRKQLKPRWVQAIIPDFKLHGAMFLTNDLQNLGICDVFEPNRADLRPMTDEKGIYVKHIEQSINVNIRTHPINQLKRNYGAPQLQPIQISVNHPFLFYIIDRDLDVAVMAGRILNPLNVRIQ